MGDMLGCSVCTIAIGRHADLSDTNPVGLKVIDPTG